MNTTPELLSRDCSRPRTLTEQRRRDVLKQRRNGFACQFDLDPAERVFVGETGASTKLAKGMDAARPGRRLGAAVPHGHDKTITPVASLAPSRACRPEALRKADERPLQEWVDKRHVPTLSRGDIVVIDKLPADKGARIEQPINSADAESRYLPPSSPDMNPIEKAFSKLKAARASSPSEPSPA